MSRQIKSLKNISWVQTHKMILFAVLFAAIGTYIVFITQAATNTQTFTGKITTRQQTQSFDVAAVAGQLDATLTQKDTASMTLTLSNASGTVIATKTGSSPLTLSTSVTTGNYKLAVASASQIPKKGITFALSATYATASDSVVPTAPTNLVSKSTSATTIDLGWTASTDNVGVVGYDVYRGGVEIGTTAATTYTDTGLASNTAYSYEVKARDAAGNTSAPTTVNVTTSAPIGDTQAPSAPANLKATAINNYQINLTWNGATDNVGVTGYIVYKAGSEVATTTATSYEHNNLTPQTTYTYTVKAKDAAGNLSAASNSAVATTTSVIGDTTPPSAPTNFKATVNSPTQVTLSWTASTDNVGVVSYKLTRSPHYPSGSILANLGSSAGSYTDTSVKPNSLYNYYLEASDAAGNSNTAKLYSVFTGGSANVTVTYPAVGSTVSGNITVSGTALSRSGQVSKVEVASSYGSYQPANGTTNWTAQIDTTKILDSTAEIINKQEGGGEQPIDRYIFVKVTDSTGDFKVTAVPIKVKNDTTSPTATLISPAQNTSSAPGFQTITGTASDNVGVKQVYLTSFNGSPQGQIIADGTTNWTATFAILNNNFPVNRIVVVDVNGNKTEVPIDIWTPGSSFTGSISGRSYQDANKNGIYDSGDQPLANQYVYLYTKNKGMGQYLGNTKTDAEGKYSFSDLQDGDYRVAYNLIGWRDIWYDWVSSNNSVKGFTSSPYQYVSLNGSTTADFPWRKVERIPNNIWYSQDHYGVIGSYTGPNGLTTQQYDDFVPAKAIYDRVMTGKLIGAEAAKTTVNEGNQRASSYTIGFTSAGNTKDGATGRCIEASAISSVYWPFWQGEYEDNDNATLFHEYGHNWQNYWSCLHQDPGFVEYLRVRGIDLTGPVNSSYMWSALEIIAEDYRQLFNGATTLEYQANPFIPRAAEVPDLKDYMTNTYRTLR